MTRVWRGARLTGVRDEVLVQDEIQADHPAEVRWFMHTPALITIEDDGRKATLTLGKARLLASVLSPADARLKSWRRDH